MQIPKLRQSPQKQQTINTFGGYDHNLRIPDGSFYEMKNMTSDHFPVLASRPGRGALGLGAPVNGIVSCHGLCYVQGEEFNQQDGWSVNMGLTPGRKNMIAMGAYVIIMPDKKWVNVAELKEHVLDTTPWGTLENQWESGTAQVQLQACDPNGDPVKEESVATQKPTQPYDGQLWQDGETLKRWNADQSVWEKEESYCLKLLSPGIGAGFYQGDTVKVEVEDSQVQLPKTSRILQHSEDFLVLRGYVLTSPHTLTGENALKLRRDIPDMDLVFECGNRLWGCKYGLTESGFLNEIYCSRLGDFRNWHSFEGLSTDSYAVSIGTGGPFTGGIAYMGRPLFFKENCMIEVYGSHPANYQTQITPCSGVQKNCQKSLAVVNNVLYYKSRQGICAFDGSMPVQIDDVFGGGKFDFAVAGAWGNKYYISMPEGVNRNLFVYDTLRRLWHREDDTIAADFALCDDAFYCLTTDTSKILILSGGGIMPETHVDWMVQTGPMGLTDPQSRYISRLSLRLWLGAGSTATISCCYDNDPCWQHLTSLEATQLGSICVPIRPRRCDHMRLKLEGNGPVRVYSITKIWEEGSDLR